MSALAHGTPAILASLGGIAEGLGEEGESPDIPKITRRWNGSLPILRHLTIPLTRYCQTAKHRIM